MITKADLLIDAIEESLKRNLETIKLLRDREEPSKGECSCTFDTFCPIHRKKIDPPEHEESPKEDEWEEIKKEVGNIWSRYKCETGIMGDILNLIKEKTVSKEKIKSSGVSIIRGFYLKGRNDEINKRVPDLEKLTEEIEYQLKNVGLGD